MQLLFRKFEGINYRSVSAYRFLSTLKRGINDKKRFEIAAGYLQGAKSVIDFCAGTGELKRFLSFDCKYCAVDASREFLEALAKKGIENYFCNLHTDSSAFCLRAEASVMMISLCHFNPDGVERILEQLKQTAKEKVVIVEEVLPKERGEDQARQRLMHYLCQRDFYRPIKLFTHESFKRALEKQQYQYQFISPDYAVGLFEHGSQNRV